MSTIIHYFIPDDREDSEKLNAFVIYKDYKEVRIHDVIENFPIPGEYHFRFKFEFMKKTVYIDFNNPTANLPKYDSKILMKVTRVGWKNSKDEKSEQRDNDFPDI